MRLSEKQGNAIHQAIKDVKGEVFLFGSRVDDKKKGGDIDLLVFSEEDAFSLSRKISVSFFMNCEEKIDVVVMNPHALTDIQKAFLATITKEKFA